MHTEKDTKHRQIFRQLVAEFSSPRYQLGDKLPTEREVAVNLNVNIATVRRAFRELVLAEIVIKKVGSGTYLKQKISSDTGNKPVSLVIAESNTQAFTQQIVEAFNQITHEQNRVGRVIRVSPATLPEVLNSCTLFHQPTIVMTGFGEEYFQNMDCSHLVLLSSMAYRNNVPCVLSNDLKAISLQIDHLRKRGSKRIALLTHVRVSSLTDFQISVWQQLQVQNDPALLFTVENKDVHPMQGAYTCIKEKIRTIDFDGLICLSDELMFGAMAALRETGKCIPQDVAITSIGNTLLAQFANPTVTSVDSDAVGHIQNALELLDYNDKHPDKLEYLRHVPVQLIVRESSVGSKNSVEKK